jgi:hypothetical protein
VILQKLLESAKSNVGLGISTLRILHIPLLAVLSFGFLSIRSYCKLEDSLT